MSVTKPAGLLPQTYEAIDGATAPTLEAMARQLGLVVGRVALGRDELRQLLYDQMGAQQRLRAEEVEHETRIHEHGERQHYMACSCGWVARLRLTPAAAAADGPAHLRAAEAA